MQNDLVKRGEVLKIINEHRGNSNRIEEEIMKLECAYDVERIVEQLESNKWDIHDWRDRWRNEIIDECIGVIKGGVDNAG